MNRENYSESLDFNVIHIACKQNVTNDNATTRFTIQPVRRNRTKRQVKAIIEVDHDVVLDTTERETEKDAELKSVKEAIQTAQAESTKPGRGRS